jgi:hypothetical protein
MPLTLISHFWDEEFLLPYWLRHHVPLFDHGVLLDYASTDRSRDIIRELAPGLEVRPSRNQTFDARDVDAEVMEVEREFQGWKVVLNTTEFLLCEDLGHYLRQVEEERPTARGLWAFDLAMIDPPAEAEREMTESPLYFQKRWGLHHQGNRSRLLHRLPDGRYDTGRHTSPLVPKTLETGLFVLWFAWSPMRYLRGRKLKIQERIPPRDRAAGLGRHHLLTPAELEANYRHEATRAYDLLERHPPYRELIETLARRAGLPIIPPSGGVSEEGGAG